MVKKLLMALAALLLVSACSDQRDQNAAESGQNVSQTGRLTAEEIAAARETSDALLAVGDEAEVASGYADLLKTMQSLREGVTSRKRLLLAGHPGAVSLQTVASAKPPVEEGQERKLYGNADLLRNRLRDIRRAANMVDPGAVGPWRSNTKAVRAQLNIFINALESDLERALQLHGVEAVVALTNLEARLQTSRASLSDPAHDVPTITVRTTHK